MFFILFLTFNFLWSLSPSNFISWSSPIQKQILTSLSEGSDRSCVSFLTFICEKTYEKDVSLLFNSFQKEDVLSLRREVDQLYLYLTRMMHFYQSFLMMKMTNLYSLVHLGNFSGSFFEDLMIETSFDELYQKVTSQGIPHSQSLCLRDLYLKVFEMFCGEPVRTAFISEKMGAILQMTSSSPFFNRLKDRGVPVQTGESRLLTLSSSNQYYDVVLDLLPVEFKQSFTLKFSSQELEGRRYKIDLGAYGCVGPCVTVTLSFKPQIILGLKKQGLDLDSFDKMVMLNSNHPCYETLLKVLGLDFQKDLEKAQKNSLERVTLLSFDCPILFEKDLLFERLSLPMSLFFKEDPFSPFLLQMYSVSKGISKGERSSVLGREQKTFIYVWENIVLSNFFNHLQPSCSYQAQTPEELLIDQHIEGLFSNLVVNHEQGNLEALSKALLADRSQFYKMFSSSSVYLWWKLFSSSLRSFSSCFFIYDQILSTFWPEYSCVEFFDLIGNVFTFDQALMDREKDLGVYQPSSRFTFDRMSLVYRSLVELREVLRKNSCFEEPFLYSLLLQGDQNFCHLRAIQYEGVLSSFLNLKQSIVMPRKHLNDDVMVHPLFDQASRLSLSVNFQEISSGFWSRCLTSDVLIHLENKPRYIKILRRLNALIRYRSSLQKSHYSQAVVLHSECFQNTLLPMILILENGHTFSELSTYFSVCQTLDWRYFYLWGESLIRTANSYLSDDMYIDSLEGFFSSLSLSFDSLFFLDSSHPEVFFAANKNDFLMRKKKNYELCLAHFKRIDCLRLSFYKREGVDTELLFIGELLEKTLSTSILSIFKMKDYLQKIKEKGLALKTKLVSLRSSKLSFLSIKKTDPLKLLWNQLTMAYCFHSRPFFQFLNEKSPFLSVQSSFYLQRIDEEGGLYYSSVLFLLDQLLNLYHQEEKLVIDSCVQDEYIEKLEKSAFFSNSMSSFLRTSECRTLISMVYLIVSQIEFSNIEDQEDFFFFILERVVYCFYCSEKKSLFLFLDSFNSYAEQSMDYQTTYFSKIQSPLINPHIFVTQCLLKQFWGHLNQSNETFKQAFFLKKGLEWTPCLVLYSFRILEKMMLLILDSKKNTFVDYHQRSLWIYDRIRSSFDEGDETLKKLSLQDIEDILKEIFFHGSLKNQLKRMKNLFKNKENTFCKFYCLLVSYNLLILEVTEDLVDQEILFLKNLEKKPWTPLQGVTVAENLFWEEYCSILRGLVFDEGCFKDLSVVDHQTIVELEIPQFCSRLKTQEEPYLFFNYFSKVFTILLLYSHPRTRDFLLYSWGSRITECLNALNYSLLALSSEDWLCQEFEKPSYNRLCLALEGLSMPFFWRHHQFPSFGQQSYVLDTFVLNLPHFLLCVSSYEKDFLRSFEFYEPWEFMVRFNALNDFLLKLKKFGCSEEESLPLFYFEFFVSVCQTPLKLKDSRIQFLLPFIRSDYQQKKGKRSSLCYLKKEEQLLEKEEFEKFVSQYNAEEMYCFSAQDSILQSQLSIRSFLEKDGLDSKNRSYLYFKKRSFLWSRQHYSCLNIQDVIDSFNQGQIDAFEAFCLLAFVLEEPYLESFFSKKMILLEEHFFYDYAEGRDLCREEKALWVLWTLLNLSMDDIYHIVRVHDMIPSSMLSFYTVRYQKFLNQEQILSLVHYRSIEVDIYSYIFSWSGSIVSAYCCWKTLEGSNFIYSFICLALDFDWFPVESSCAYLYLLHSLFDPSLSSLSSNLNEVFNKIYFLKSFKDKPMRFWKSVLSDFYVVFLHNRSSVTLEMLKFINKSFSVFADRFEISCFSKKKYRILKFFNFWDTFLRQHQSDSFCLDQLLSKYYSSYRKAYERHSFHILDSYCFDFLMKMYQEAFSSDTSFNEKLGDIKNMIGDVFEQPRHSFIYFFHRPQKSC